MKKDGGKAGDMQHPVLRPCHHHDATQASENEVKKTKYDKIFLYHEKNVYICPVNFIL
jgi:hypothetical protein